MGDRPPLSQAALDAMALRYVARYATTEAKLRRYLESKLRQRGGDGAINLADIVARMTRLGFVDDRAYAAGRSAALARRGYGRSRVAAALAAAGVDRSIAQELAPDDEGEFAAADAFARRRRIGPYAATPSDPDRRQRNLAAMARAGHAFALARRFVDAAPGDVPDRNT